MFPIKTETKSRRMHWDGCPSTATWVFLKHLREMDDTKKIYPVNSPGPG